MTKDGSFDGVWIMIAVIFICWKLLAFVVVLSLSESDSISHCSWNFNNDERYFLIYVYIENVICFASYNSIFYPS